MATDDAVETAWRIHDALADWTGKVDAKASFALTLESAVLGALAAFSGTGHRFGHLHGALPKTLFWLGVLLLGLSAVVSALVVVPRLAGQDGGTPRTNFVYFGDLRLWDPELLATRLTDTSPLQSLTRQLVVMSRIAWIKHRRVQLSFALAGAGTLAVALAWTTG